MNGVKNELTTLTFTGPRFEDHGLDVDIFSEIIAYKKILFEIAEYLWRKSNPDRERLPKGFKDVVHIKFYNLLEGSTAIPLFKVKEGVQSYIPYELNDEYDMAADILEEGIQAASINQPLPENLPRNILQFFEEFGKSLDEEEAILAKSPRRSYPAKYSSKTRKRLLELVSIRYEDIIEVTGSVRAADLDGLNFVIRTQDNLKIGGKFLPEQEGIITDALKNHDSIEVKAKGWGEFDPESGSLRKFSRIDSLETASPQEDEYNPDAKPIWETIQEISKKVPMSVWESIPADLSRNVDKYLYRTNGKE
ncbi:MAG: hypothetical protein NTY09_06350 [bacterium]|nr:hypothetical protein [bacterium]